jgi:hypothetical protein
MVVGASHADRLAKALKLAGQEVVAITSPGWRPTKTKVSEMKKSVAEGSDLLISEGRRVVAIFFMLDNIAYNSSSVEDGLTLAHRGADGKYDILGSVAVSPLIQLTPALKLVGEVVEAAGESEKIFLTPLPRYLNTPCCDSGDHCENIKEPDYKTGMLKATTQMWRDVKSYLHRGCRGTSTLNPLWLLTGDEKLGLVEQIEMADRLWEEQDPVHMGEEGYFRMAAGILNFMRSSERAASSPAGDKRGTDADRKRAALFSGHSYRPEKRFREEAHQAPTYFGGGSGTAAGSRGTAPRGSFRGRPGRRGRSGRQWW